MWPPADSLLMLRLDEAELSKGLCFLRLSDDSLDEFRARSVILATAIWRKSVTVLPPRLPVRYFLPVVVAAPAKLNGSPRC